jgi:hypothetical protein
MLFGQAITHATFHPRHELTNSETGGAEEARGRRAALPGRAERAPDRAVDRQVHVRVVHHEDRVLSAHLQVQPLERRRAGLRDPAPDLGRARLRDDLHVRMLDQRVSDLAARAGDDVEDARR